MSGIGRVRLGLGESIRRAVRAADDASWGSTAGSWIPLVEHPLGVVVGIWWWVRGAPEGRPPTSA